MKNQLIALLAALVILLVLGIRNMDPVTLDYVVGDLRIPLAYLIAGFVVAGLALGLTVAMTGRFRSGRQQSRLRSEIESRDQEIDRLREKLARQGATAETAAESQAPAGVEQEGAAEKTSKREHFPS